MRIPHRQPDRNLASMAEQYEGHWSIHRDAVRQPNRFSRWVAAQMTEDREGRVKPSTSQPRTEGR
jgi:hypothetical protein